jgi:hypothetical protein
MSPHERDRRLEPRTSEVVQVEYVAPSPRVRDLSVSGVYIVDPRTLQRGQPVDLSLRLDDKDPIVVRGMVRRVDESQGMAIEFISMDAAARRRLKEFVARSSPEKLSPAGEDVI